MLGTGIMAIFSVIGEASGFDINSWMTPPMEEGDNWLVAVLSSAAFWTFAIGFLVKTICTLIYNYVSRKKILFKGGKFQHGEEILNDDNIIDDNKITLNNNDKEVNNEEKNLINDDIFDVSGEIEIISEDDTIERDKNYE
ncbi:MAG: hypothetical protein ATN31_02410 [Candidatus Epulonipiscioides saccharophilum]|nr:MAG: hypothetical protein ATN31_02410 [Epulopiscium sp. AS2M-Bin001]